MDKRHDMHRAAEEIEELFADLWQVFPFSRGGRRGYRPQVDVLHRDTPPTLTVLVELPGIAPEEVKLIAAPRALVIAGERPRPSEEGHYEQLEIEYGPFQRKIALAQDVDPDRATATYERGILRIELPIAREPTPRASVSIPVGARR
jgi:HSP20 family protein